MGKYTELDHADRNFTHLAKLIGRKARATWLQGDLSAAINIYEDALMEASDAQLSMDLKECKKLKEQADKAAYLNPELGDKHREAGNALFKDGKYGPSIIEFDEALKRNPKDHKALANKSSSYIKAYLRKASVHNFLKEFHKALDTYDQIMKIEPDNTEAKDGKQKTQVKIASSMHETGNDEERLKRAMQDPEIQMIMMDPMVKIALNQMQSSPKGAQSYFTDATLGPKLQKLIQAGVLKVG